MGKDADERHLVKIYIKHELGECLNEILVQKKYAQYKAKEGMAKNLLGWENISGLHETAASPLLTHWRYCYLVLLTINIQGSFCLCAQPIRDVTM